jgi:nitrite reductase/ring-hydroxylating ferredoxin subunit
MAVLRIGREADFPAGGVTRRTFLGRHVGIFRRADGALAATEVTCRHQNADLSLGERDGDVVTCPRHGWRYDLATGECLTESWARLRTFRVWSEAGEVWLDTTPRIET